MKINEGMNGKINDKMSRILNSKASCHFLNYSHKILIIVHRSSLPLDITFRSFRFRNTLFPHTLCGSVKSSVNFFCFFCCHTPIFLQWFGILIFWWKSENHSFSAGKAGKLDCCTPLNFKDFLRDAFFLGFRPELDPRVCCTSGKKTSLAGALPIAMAKNCISGWFGWKLSKGRGLIQAIVAIFSSGNPINWFKAENGSVRLAT